MYISSISVLLSDLATIVSGLQPSCFSSCNLPYRVYYKWVLGSSDTLPLYFHCHEISESSFNMKFCSQSCFWVIFIFFYTTAFIYVNNFTFSKLLPAFPESPQMVTMLVFLRSVIYSITFNSDPWRQFVSVVNISVILCIYFLTPPPVMFLASVKFFTCSNHIQFYSHYYHFLFCFCTFVVG